MQVILLKDTKGLGKKNEIKSVADGYAKNYLIPQNLVREVDKASLSELNNEIVAKQNKKQEQKSILDSIALNLKDNPLTLSIKTGKRGEVFGSVTKTEILKELTSRFSLNKETTSEIEIVGLDKPIKTLGTHRIESKLGNARGKIKVNVVGLEK